MAEQRSLGVVTLLGTAGAVIGGGTAWGLTRFGETARLPVRVGIFVEEADGHTEDSSHLEEAACSDSIDSLFVLLDLLERKT